MSTKHVRNASDLARFRCALRVECGACANCVTITGFDLATARLTGDFASVQRRLKCSLCSAKDARLTVLPPPEPR